MTTIRILYQTCPKLTIMMGLVLILVTYIFIDGVVLDAIRERKENITHGKHQF